MQVTVRAELPPLSWLVEISDKQIQGLSGANVELFDHGLLEGCWDADVA